MKPALAAAAAAMVLLAACGDPQPGPSAARKADGRPWDAPPGEFVAEGWKSGDQASWEQQLRQRAQHQNEYTRAPVKSQ